MKLKTLKRLVRTSPLGGSSLYHGFRYNLRKGQCDRFIERYVGKGIDSARKQVIAEEMKSAMIDYHWDFSEYFMYNFSSLSHEERLSFVPEYEKNIFCARVNDPVKSLIFDSKWNTYLLFKDFFGRDVILCKSIKDLISRPFIEFVSAHRKFIVKPDAEASGRGIRILEVSDHDDARKKIVGIYGVDFRSLIMEELVIQDDRMGMFHPQSVNTLRVRTFRFDDRVEMLPCNMRIGQGNAVVDNTGKGGISVALDSSGCAIAACDEYGTRYINHPDTGVPIIGFQIPLWDEVVSLAHALAMTVPEVRYVGWDIALSNNGWVLIEGNDKSMFVGIQKPTQKGFRPEVNRILGELGKKM